MYVSFLEISRALHPDIFDQPAGNCFLNILLDSCVITPAVTAQLVIGNAVFPYNGFYFTDK